MWLYSGDHFSSANIEHDSLYLNNCANCSFLLPVSLIQIGTIMSVTKNIVATYGDTIYVPRSATVTIVAEYANSTCVFRIATSDSVTIIV